MAIIALQNMSDSVRNIDKDVNDDNDDILSEDTRESLHLMTLNQVNGSLVKTFAILLTIFVSIYFIVGVSVYSQWTGWTPFNAFYFSVITFTTIGYGDFVPQTQNQRLFTCFFIVIGVGILGSSVAILRSQLQAHQERLELIKQSETMLKLEDRIRSSIGSFEASVEQGIDSVISNDKRPSSIKRIINAISGYTSFSKNNDKSNVKIEAIKDAVIESYDDEVRSLRWSLFNNLIAILVIIGVGGLCMAFIENWSGITAVYWACITITTVGYGDVVPTCNLGKAFTIIYALVGCGYMAKSIEDIAKVPVAMRLKQSEIQVLNQFTGDLSKQKLKKIFTNSFFKKIPRLRHSNDAMTKSEFVLLLLHMMNKLDDKDLLIVSEIFEKLDRDGNGVLSSAEMRAQLLNAKNETIEEIDRPSGLQFIKSNVVNLLRTFSDGGENDNISRSSSINASNNVINHLHSSSNSNHNESFDI